jgi:hypothetical protein
VSSLDKLGRQHAEEVRSSVAKVELPSYSLPSLSTARKRRGAWIAAASATAVLAVFLPVAIWGPDAPSIGQSDPSAPIAPPETLAPVPSTEAETETPDDPWACPVELRGSEVAVDEAHFPIVVVPPTVSAGSTVEIQIHSPDGSSGRVTSPAVVWQCWNGGDWVDTHLLHTATLGADGVGVGVPWIAETQEFWWIQAVGLPVPHHAVVRTPDVPPGTYRIVASITAAEPGANPGLTSFAFIEVTTSQQPDD